MSEKEIIKETKPRMEHAIDDVRRTKVRLEEYITFYAKLRGIYAEILAKNLLEAPRGLFRKIYEAPPERIPEIKVLDFIFWSAGKLSIEAGVFIADHPRPS